MGGARKTQLLWGLLASLIQHRQDSSFVSTHIYKPQYLLSWRWISQCNKFLFAEKPRKHKGSNRHQYSNYCREKIVIDGICLKPNNPYKQVPELQCKW